MSKQQDIVPETLEKRTLSKATAHLTGLLTENWPDIFAAFCECANEDSPMVDKPPCFSVSAAIKLKPEGQNIRVSCRISYGIKKTDETAPQVVSLQPELFDGNSNA
jgi:hypothetical protein